MGEMWSYYAVLRGSLGRVFVLRMDPHEDMLESIQKL